MGLDMYLRRETHIWRNPDKTFDVILTVTENNITKPVGHIDSKKVKSITEEVMYWRKANHIHRWFVDNVQEGVDECQESYVSIEQLNELKDLCKEVKDNPKKAETDLPPGSGFFFGGTEIDQWYWDDLDDTISGLTEIIEHHKKVSSHTYVSYYYQSSW